MASLSRPAVSASPVQPGVRNVGNAVLASHLENTRDVLDSDDELIGADQMKSHLREVIKRKKLPIGLTVRNYGSFRM